MFPPVIIALYACSPFQLASYSLQMTDGHRPLRIVQLTASDILSETIFKLFLLVSRLQVN